MSLMDILRKLNIVRYGAKKATYRNAKDRPIEFMVDNVYNAEREIINLNAPDQPAPPQPAALPPVISSVPGPRPCPKCGTALPSDAKFCSSCGAPVVGVPPAASPTASPAVPRKSSSKWVGCLIGGVIGFVLLVVLLVVLAIIGSQDRKSKQAVDSKPVPVAASPAAATVQEIPVATPAPAALVNDSVKPAPPAAPPAQEPYKPTSPAMPAPPSVPSSAGYVPGAATAGQPAAAGAVRYDRYANPKFGFVTELPAHWESEVKDNSHLFSGPKGAEDYRVTINFQFITMTSANSLPQQRRTVIDQWRRMQDYRLVEDETHNFQNQYLTVYLHATYKLPDKDTLWEQTQIIVERQPYYYCIGYTAPQALFEKYYPHMKHLIQTLRFTPIAQ
ncbi:MAG: zinc ribbon domain-containing protein [Verrucomicrobiia bacterium]